MPGTRRKAESLTPFVPGYRAKLLALGYAPETARGLLKVLGQLGRWMTDNEIAVSQLNWETIERFLAYRSADSFRQTPHRRGLRLLLEFLVDEHIVAAAEPAPLSELDSLLGDYWQWLVDERGLAETTVLRYHNCARRFLGLRTAAGVADVGSMTGVEVSAFLLAEAQRCSVGAAKGRVAELRALLRYLYLRGLTVTLLSGSIPPVAGWHDTGIPPALSRGDVEALLGSCDQTTVGGLRDYAMLMLLVRLGLRAIEVSRLELSDIDWRCGEIRIRGKTRRVERMPLPVDVGTAVSAYLIDGRPRLRQHRQVFLTLRAPIRAVRADLLGDVVGRACVRAGLPAVGAHRLRHAVATALLSEGVPLVDISQVLRHRDLATTAIYAKVDLASLRKVARPWPGAIR